MFKYEVDAVPQFRLHDIARMWYQSLLRERPVDSPALTWDEFSDAFMARFLPECVRDARAMEFERLVKTPNISEYNVRFSQLSRYAPYLVAAEKMRISGL